MKVVAFYANPIYLPQAVYVEYPDNTPFEHVVKELRQLIERDAFMGATIYDANKNIIGKIDSEFNIVSRIQAGRN